MKEFKDSNEAPPRQKRGGFLERDTEAVTSSIRSLKGSGPCTACKDFVKQKPKELILWPRMYKIKAQAMMITVTFLSLLFIVGVAFLSLSQTERTSSLRHLDAIRTRYLAEAGVTYAIKVLNLDRLSNLVDSLQDLTFQHFSGLDADLDLDGKMESRWINIMDSQGHPFGRFSIKITDEASKININTCDAQTLERLFSQLGLNSSNVNNLLSRRPFNAIEQIGSILEKKEFTQSKDFLTVYSKDSEIDLERKRRTYINSPSSQVILQAFLEAGISDAYQKAANLKDASDADLCQTRMDRFIRKYMIPLRVQNTGGWQMVGNYYEAQKGGNPGKFTWSNLSIEDGEYFCSVYGPRDNDVVGEVYLEGEENLGTLLFSGESMNKKVTVSGGSLTLNIKPAEDRISRFSHIELISLEPKKGLSREIITGTEALVINELMVKPSKEFLLDNPAELTSGQSLKFTFTKIRPGYYYVMVFAKRDGELVGDVDIYGRVAGALHDKDYIPYSVNISSSGTLTVEVKNNSLGTASFKGIKISQQPDAEFIELLNLSGEEIDISNFSFEVYTPQNELVAGWPGRIPQGITIAPYQYLVFAVDSNDASISPANLIGNHISFSGAWGSSSVGLKFDEYSDSIDKTFDLLPDKGATVLLKDDSGRQVDAVEYDTSQVKDFVSMEKGDPSSKIDADSDGSFDGWYASENKNGTTPGSANENAGMYTLDENNQLVKHSASEITVFNHPLSGFSDALQLSTGRDWKKFSLSDISLMADRFSCEAIELGLAGHYKAGEFKEKSGIFESSKKGETGEWEFTKIAAGNYLLSISSDSLATEGQEIKAAYKTDSKEEFKNYSSLLFTQGFAFYGGIELKEGYSAFGLRIINESGQKLDLKNIKLEPIASAMGRININTAKPEVLRSIFSQEAMVEAILQNRPIGNKDQRLLGVGELFSLDSNFISLTNYLTVRSDIYEIISRGEYFPQGKTLAYQTIRTVIEREQ